ncbi:hypothetical protein D1B33_04705 [Lysinibacillus yapensis]|uniref:Uncharacterized protein n=1 Tax=Ureibacillus yapensis TaxID=2304605 RepID=A0A396SAN9_9BACL|nr:hypothetical protein [Lysinibacillus yapensis]RHW38192.1 hypothetical protein D1B33_04705 [Lysinibacillus yapensis]
MKKIMHVILMVISVVILSACQKDEVSEEDVKAFVTEYKSITHDIPVPEEAFDFDVLEKVKPYLNDEWFKMNERDKRVYFPRSYVSVSGNAVSLNDVLIDNLEENPDGEGYAVKYTLLLTVGDEEVKKEGDMKIIEGKPKGFIITYDWEKQITVNRYHFR